MELARRAGVSPATMNRDLEFLDAYTAVTPIPNNGGKARPAAADSEQVRRLRHDNSQLETAVQLLAESVQALTLENERLRDELRRRHNLAPVEDPGTRLSNPANRRPRR